ncbi:hypothetical protein [Mameliella sp.]|uniref:hypothetical protein n=1 Tax=Mameliella sp. TaxID=1924940 RepID=UPI003B5014FC
MKKPRHRVTDHAVLRYLERVQGIDIEALRRELGARIDAACEDFEGMCAVNIEGISFRRSQNGIVTTCFEQNRPDKGHSGPPRKRDIE